MVALCIRCTTVCVRRAPTSATASPFRPSTQENEAAPHVALDIRPDGGTAGEQHRRGPSDAITEASEAAGDPDLALELEVLRSEELAAGGDEDQVPASHASVRKTSPA